MKTEKMTALKTFRVKGEKGTVVTKGDSIEVDSDTAHQYESLGIAARGSKALKEYENKMQADLANKGLPTEEQTPEERSEGVTGPVKKSQTPAQRSEGMIGVAKKKDDDERPHSQLPGREIRS